MAFEHTEKLDIKSAWLETRDAPAPPVIWFIDDQETDETVAFTRESDEKAWKILSTLLWKYPFLQVRTYAPTPEEWERDLEYARKVKNWNRGFGAPSRPWQAVDADNGVIRPNY